MAAIILPEKWSQLPKGPVRLASNLPSDTVAWLPQTVLGQPYYPRTGSIQEVTSDGNLALTPSAGGYVNLGKLYQLPVGATILFGGTVTSTAQTYVYGEVNYGSSYIEVVRPNTNHIDGAATGKLNFQLRNNSNQAFLCATTNAVFTVGVPFVAAFTQTGNVTGQWYFNGQAVASTVGFNANTGTDPTQLTGYPVALTAVNSRGTITSSTNLKLSVFARITTAVDAQALTQIPALIFEKQARIYFLPSAGGGGATITAATESLTLSTFGATVGSARDIAGALESLSLTPYAALVSRASALTAAVESISLGTYAATVANNATIAGGLESIALTANAASVTLGAAIAAAMESIVLAANPAAVRLDAAVAAQLEQITITGLGASIATGSNIGAQLESITLSVPQALVSSDRTIAGGLESITVTANGATVTLGALIGAALENIALTSHGAGITLNVALAGGLEQINLTTLAAQIGLGSNVAALVEAITLTEFGATLTMTGEITAALESIGLTTFVASITGGESALTTPGLEFTIPVGRMHYSIPVGRIHFTIPRD